MKIETQKLKTIKNKRVFILIAFAVVIAVLVFFGYIDEEKSSDASQKGQTKEITIIDGNGEAITVRKPVNRIIVEYIDNAELVSILNKKDKVVGVDFAIKQTKNQFPELSQRPSLGDMNKPDYEAVLKLKPDLLLTFSPETTEKKEKLPGVSVVFLGLYYPDLLNPQGSRFIKGVRNLGRILEAEKEAEGYIKWYLGLINKIGSKTKSLPNNKMPKVFITTYAHLSNPTYKTPSRRDTLSQMAILAGGRNIAEGLPEWNQDKYMIQVNPEWVIAQNPDIIILHAVRYTFGGKILEPPHGYDADDITGIKKGLSDFMGRQELANVNAIKNKKVYIFSGTFRNDASGGVIGAAYMAKIFHPELFKDLNPEAIHQQYLKMQRLNYDLNRHGIFVYPPIEENGALMGIPDRYKGQTFIDADYGKK